MVIRINKEVRNYQEEPILRSVPAAVAVRTRWAVAVQWAGLGLRPVLKWGDRLGLRACSLSLALGGFFSA